MQGCAALLALALWAIGGRVAEPERGVAESPRLVAPAELAQAEAAPAAMVVERPRSDAPAYAPFAGAAESGLHPVPRLRMGSSLGARAP